MSTDYAQGQKLLTKGEVAQMCRVESRTIDRWVAAGKLVCYRTPGGRPLFRRKDVLMMVERGAEPRPVSTTLRDIVGHLVLFTAAAVV